jgi:pimeloyl-ACP methyl ester carboxylesterase
MRPGRRNLSFTVSGDADGFPVFLFHGTPGSGTGPKPRSIRLSRLGITLISHDRPGYGGSDRHEGRTVRDVAEDVAAIADDLNIERFAVVGRSGGGPHALASAAVLRDRVERAAALVSLAPANADNLDWYDGMNHGNTLEFERAATDQGDPFEAVRLGTPETEDLARGLLRWLEPQLTWSDRRVVNDIAMRRLLLGTYADGLHRGTAGWWDDLFAFRRPWGVDLADITCPVVLWHGSDDQFSPLSHSRWLKLNIPQADLLVQPDTGHFGAVEVLPMLLPWLSGAMDRESLLCTAESWHFGLERHAGPDPFDPLTGGGLRTAHVGRSPDTPDSRTASLSPSGAHPRAAS